MTRVKIEVSISLINTCKMSTQNLFLKVAKLGPKHWLFLIVSIPLSFISTEIASCTLPIREHSTWDKSDICSIL